METVSLELLAGGVPDACKIATAEGTNAGATATLAAPGAGSQYLLKGFSWQGDADSVLQIKFGVALRIEINLDTTGPHDDHGLHEFPVPLPVGENVALSAVLAASAADCQVAVWAFKVPV